MATVTADHVRQLARSDLPDPVLVLLNGDVRVESASVVADTPAARLIYTRNRLIDEAGEDITDIEAEVLAAGLTNQITEAPGG